MTHVKGHQSESTAKRKVSSELDSFTSQKVIELLIIGFQVQ